jgi:hypothetical protein
MAYNEYFSELMKDYADESNSTRIYILREVCRILHNDLWENDDEQHMQELIACLEGIVKTAKYSMYLWGTGETSAPFLP